MTDSSSHDTQPGPERLRPILVGVDFSSGSKAALLWACKFCECTSAKLVLLHVVHDPATSPGFYRSQGQDDLEPMEVVAASMMTDFLDETRAEYPDLDALHSIETRLIEGLPAGRIVEVAELLKAQMIVVGSRGLTGLQHALLGSVAQGVVEHAPMTVVVVKPKDLARKKGDKKKRVK